MELEKNLLPEGSTLLHLAVNNNNTSALSSLMAGMSPQELEEALEQIDRHCRTPLCVALELGRLEAAAILIRSGARLNVGVGCLSSQWKHCPLLFEPGYSLLVHDQIKKGGDLSLNELQSSTNQQLCHSVLEPAYRLLMKTLKDKEIKLPSEVIAWLERLEASQGKDLKKLPFSSVCPFNRLEFGDLSFEPAYHVFVHLLQNQGVETTFKLNHPSSYRRLRHLLEEPVYHPMVHMLVKEGVKLPLNKGLLHTMVLSAAQTGDEQLLREILEGYEVNVDSRDLLGLSALHYASHNGYASMVRLLLKHGAIGNLQDSRGKTALHIACTRSHLDAVREILAANSGTSVELDNILNVQDHSGHTCCHAALYHKRYDVLAHILDNFATSLDLKLRDTSGHTLSGLLFYFRFRLNALSKSAWLSLPCLSVEEASWSLHVAASEGDRDLLLHALTSNAVPPLLDCFDFTNMSPLMWASRRGHLEVCRALVERGADFNLADEHGVTALHHACYSDQLDVVEYVLSLSHLKMETFFNTFQCRSISTELLERFVEYFATAHQPRKPAEWQRWLVMAAGNKSVTRSLFSSLVEAMCPKDWLKQLFNRVMNEQSPPAVAACQPTNHCYLPLYEVHLNKEDPNYCRLKSESFRVFLKRKRITSREPSSSKKKKQPLVGLVASKRTFKVSRDKDVGNCYEVMKFKKVKRRKATAKPSVSSGKSAKEGANRSYPLHEAVRSGNVEVVDYILDQAENESRSFCKLLLFQTEEFGVGSSLVELMATQHEKFAHHFTQSLVEEMGRRMGYSLPGEMTYPQALMHYLIVATKPETFRYVDSNVKRSLTPLDAWSPAYRRLTFHQFIVARGLVTGVDACDDPYLMPPENIQKLMSALLEREGVPDPSVYNGEKFSSLLHVAILMKCAWAVELLLDLGTPGILDENGTIKCIWDPLCDIVETSGIDLVRTLVLSDEASRHSLGDSQIQELSYGLLFLASRDLMSWAEKLYIEVVSRYDTVFWTTERAPRLIYLSYLHDCTEFARRLVSNMLRTICTYFLFPNPLDTHKYYTGTSMFCTVASALMSKRFRKESVVQDMDVSRRIFNTIQQHLSFSFFHQLCIKGDFDSVKLVLDIMKEEISNAFFNTSDQTGYLTLLYTIINGHFDIVKLLLDNGCPLIPPGDGLAELTAAILHIKLTKDRKRRWNVYLPKYLRYLWSGHSTYVLEILGTCELEASTYCHALVEFLISVSDFKSIVSSPNLDVLIHEIASLSLLHYAEPILTELGVHLEQITDGPDSDSSASTFKYTLADPALFELGIDRMKAEDDKDDTSCQNDSPEPSLKPHKLVCIACKLPPFRRTSGDLLWVIDAALCSLGSFDNIDGSVIAMACEKGLWLLVKKLLPLVMHYDDVVLNVLHFCLSQYQSDLFDSLYFELKNNHRTFVKGLGSILCTAINALRTEDVEALLGITGSGDSSMLMYPLCLAVTKHLNQAACSILAKMVGQESLQTDYIYKILEVAARHNNTHMIEHFLSKNCYLPDTVEASKEKSQLLFTMLSEAASHGHQDAALIFVNSPTVANFNPSDASDKVVAEHIRALCWCSYWGLTSVLNRIPFAKDILLTLPSVNCDDDEEVKFEEMLPLTYAEARGSLGKLADVNSLAIPTVDWEVVDKKSGIFLLVGIYPTFHNMKKDRHAATTYDFWDYSYFQDTFMREIYYGGEEYIHTYFEDHLGANNAAYFRFVCKRYDCELVFGCLVQASCKCRDGPSSLDTLLCYLAISGVDFTKNGFVKRGFARCIRKGKVDFVKVFVQHLPDLLNNFNPAHLINIAASSNNPEMVDFILGLIGDLAPESCFQEGMLYLPNETVAYLPCPLDYAFAWGRSQVICNSSLLHTASKVKDFEFSKWEKASCYHGWFHFMMEQNAKIVSQSGHLNVQSSETYDFLPTKCFSISSISRCSFKISLLRSSTRWGVDSVTQAILNSSGGVFVQLNQLSEKEVIRLSHVLMDTTVFNFLRAQPYCEEALEKFVAKTKDFDLVKVALSKVAKWQGSKEELLELFTLFQSLSTDSRLCIKIFMHSCELGLSKVAIPLINSNIFGVKSYSVLKEALHASLLHRRYDIVAEIMVKHNIAELDAEKVGGNELYQIVFSAEDYYSILNKFFGSLTSGEDSRLSLAAMWIAHSWSKREAELVVNRLGNVYAPPNPWVLPREEKGNFTITVDWNSFSESLLASPQATEQNESSFHLVPIAVEAVVFSPAVLGQIVPSFYNTGDAFEDPDDVALLSEVQRFSSVIISCSTVDEPSLTSLGGDQCLLTISYEPGTKRFTFPELRKVAPEPPTEKVPSILCDDDIDSLVMHYRKKVRATFGCQTFMKFGESLARELKSLARYCNRGVIYYDLLVMVLKDLFDALELALIPKMFYTWLNLNEKIERGMTWFLDCKSIEDERPTYIIKVKESCLFITIYLPFADDFSVESSELCSCSFYNELVEDIRLSILTDCVKKLEKEVSDIEIVIARVLSSSLNGFFNVSIIMDDIKSFDNGIINKHELTLLTVVYIKQLKRLVKFLRMFCKMLNSCMNIISCCDSFSSSEVLLDIVCQRNSGPAFFERSHGNLRMIVPVATLLTKHNDSLVRAWQSFVLVVRESPSLHSEAVLAQPSVAPIACHIDHNKSPGLFFPVVNNKRAITVQLVDHSGQDFHCLPAIDFSFSIHVDHCDSKSSTKNTLLFSSSSSRKSSGQNSIEDNNDGTVGVSWMPQKAGLHIVRIFINGVPIRGSPHKCVCMDKEALKTRKVFVAEHIGDCPLSPVPVKLFNKRPIRTDRPRTTLSREEFKRSLEQLPTHLLSLYFADCSLIWRMCMDGDICVHVGKKGGYYGARPSLKIHRISGGLHHVEVIVHQPCFMFVSCPSCMGALKMHLDDGNTSVYPVDFNL